MKKKGVRHDCTCTDIIVDREGGKTLLYMYWYNSMIGKGVRHYCTCTDIPPSLSYYYISTCTVMSYPLLYILLYQYMYSNVLPPSLSTIISVHVQYCTCTDIIVW
jgi:hypothetical protein